MTYEKIISIEELDEIAPFVEKLHKQHGLYKFISHTGFMTEMALKLPQTETYAVWKFIENEKVVGYSIVEITGRHFQKECMIVDAYTEINDEETTKRLFDQVCIWAEEKGCKILSCHTHRDSGIKEKYGFETYGTLLMKRIGD